MIIYKIIMRLLALHTLIVMIGCLYVSISNDKKTEGQMPVLYILLLPIFLYSILGLFV